MKNYRITVNGRAYDVIVEEGPSTGIPSAVTQAAPQAQASAPQAASQAQAAVPQAAAPTAPATAPQAAAPASGNTAPSGKEGSVSVAAPMPGKILGVKASVGQSVKKGDVLIILEAMKMENEIVAPSDGTVASIHVANGDSVESGKTLVTLN